jgi:antitoxin (DNA-binding transcriptional repressor) of toxin-antitoxin stability system
MKKASVREIQHHFSEMLRHIEEGEEVYITKRNKIVAKIAQHNEIQQKPVEYPDFVNRAKKICADPKGKHLSDMIIEERKERLFTHFLSHDGRRNSLAEKAGLSIVELPSI